MAANVLAALELKRRNPDMKITLIVTTNHEESRSFVKKSSDIVKTMLPNLDPNQQDIIQQTQGIHVVFLSENALHFQDQVSSKTLAAIEKADLSLQFSANKSGLRPLLMAAGRVSYDFTELGELSPLFIQNQRRLNQSYYDFPPITLTAGPGKGGVYTTDTNRDLNTLIMQNWLESFSISYHQQKPVSLAFAYSKNSNALITYYQAVAEIARAQPAQKFLLIARHELDPNFLDSPQNLTVLRYEGMPFPVMKALIQESTLPPLVTGDVSASIALSTFRKGRAFLYDQYSWKKSFVADLIQELKKHSEGALTAHDLAILENAWNYNETGRWMGSTGPTVEFMQNQVLQNRVTEALSRMQHANDLMKNALLVYRLHQIFEKEIKSGMHFFIPYLTPKLLASGSAQSLKMALLGLMSSTSESPESRAIALVSLFKFGYFRNRPPEQLFYSLKEIWALGQPAQRVFLAYQVAHETDFGQHLSKLGFTSLAPVKCKISVTIAQ